MYPSGTPIPVLPSWKSIIPIPYENEYLRWRKKDPCFISGEFEAVTRLCAIRLRSFRYRETSILLRWRHCVFWLYQGDDGSLYSGIQERPCSTKLTFLRVLSLNFLKLAPRRRFLLSFLLPSLLLQFPYTVTLLGPRFPRRRPHSMS